MNQEQLNYGIVCSDEKGPRLCMYVKQSTSLSCCFLTSINRPAKRSHSLTSQTWEMMKLFQFFLPLLFCFASVYVEVASSIGTSDGAEEWGYVEVRPGAHMFWWLYRSPQRVDNGSTPWPTILWLQGGPSASGVGIGNFQEIGPLDTNLKPRNSTWLQKADLLFVENPVGTGFSFVEEESLLAKSDREAAADLTALLKKLYNGNAAMQQKNSPLFVVAESYGGRFAVTTALSVVRAIRAGKLKLKLGGVALGNSWMSPEDYVLSWGPLLRDMSRLDANDAEKSNTMARRIKEEIDKGELVNATNTWRELEYFISARSNRVSFYNFLLDAGMEPISQMLMTKTYSSYLSSQAFSTSVDLPRFMNGVIREKLKIIPEHVKWQEQSDLVFEYFSNDFMQPRIKEVDRLLSLGITVAIYNGQLDLICSTKGTHAWVQKLKWKGLKKFTNTLRSPLHCTSEEAGVTKGFFKSYQNLQFYWILRAGHFVPVDQPCVALQMIANLTQSPAASA